MADLKHSELFPQGGGDGGNRIDLTATGTLANGATVSLRSDGTVEVASEIYAINPGSPAVFESAVTDYVSCCFDSNSNKIVIVYMDNDNSDYGTAIVGTVSGTSISFGTAVVFESASVAYISCCFDTNANKVVIAYQDSGNSNYGTAIVGTVSGTSISFGTAVVFEFASTYEISCCFDSNLNKVVIAYRDFGNSSYGTAIVGTVSGTSISFGTAVVFESAYTHFTSCCFDSNLNKVVIAYADNGNSNCGTAIVGTVSGTSISFGTAVVFESTGCYYIACCFDNNSNKVVIACRDIGNSSYGTAIVGAVSGTSISFGTAVVFETATTNFISCCFDSYNNKVIISYQDNGNSNYGTTIAGTVSGTSISFGTAVVFESAISYYVSCCFDSNLNKAVIAYRDGGNSSYGTAIVLDDVGTNADNYLGISESAVTDALATIALPGSVVTNQAGLTVNQTYYVDNDGSLVTADTTYAIVGRAISATTLLLEFDK